MRVFLSLNGRITKRLFSLVLALLVSGVFTLPANCQQTQTAADKHSQKIKKYAKRLNRWGSDEPITVKLNDGTTIKGKIEEVFEDHFIVMDRKSGRSTSIEYSNVQDLKEGLGRKTKLGLIVGGALLAIIGVCAISRRCED